MEITNDTIKQTVHGLDPAISESDEEFTVGMILLTALHTGASVKRIAAFLECPIDTVKRYEGNLRKNKIWKGTKTHQEWTGDERGRVAFWLDVLVAMGRAVKRIEFQ